MTCDCGRASFAFSIEFVLDDGHFQLPTTNLMHRRYVDNSGHRQLTYVKGYIPISPLNIMICPALVLALDSTLQPYDSLP